MINPWIFFPIIGAIIGYFTNYLAVKMIFRPRIPVMGVQGLIPRRREDLAQKIGETVSSHLVTKEDVLSNLPMNELQTHFESLIGEKVDAFIDENLMSINPMMAAFMTQDLRARIRDGVVSKMTELLPGIEEKIASSFDDMDMSALVTEKIRGFDIMKLENIILDICRKELRAIEILGGVLGAVVGLVQCWVMTQNWVGAL